jgi:hypothetical protein
VRVLSNGIGCATVEVSAPGFGTLTFAVSGANLNSLVADLAAIQDLPRVSRPEFGVAAPEDAHRNEEAPVIPRLPVVAGTSSRTIPGQEKRTA